MKRAALAVGLVALIAFSLPLTSLAASKPTFLGPIVPAECKCTSQPNPNGSGTITTAPDYGCVLQAVQNSVNFGVTLSTILFTIYILLAGLALIMSGQKTEAISKARTRLTNVVVGLAVLLSAWLVVDFIMKKLYNDVGFFGPWNSILAGKPDKSDRCIVATTPNSLTTGFVEISSSPSGTTATSVQGSGTSKLNSSTAASYALQHAQSSPTGACAKYVREALAAGGLTTFNTSHPASAYQYGPYLTNAGFTSITSGTYSISVEGSISGLQAGDVVVFQPVKGHSDGHIAIYTGSQWVSDYKQNSMSSNSSDYKGGAYTIYRP